MRRRQRDPVSVVWGAELRDRYLVLDVFAASGVGAARRGCRSDPSDDSRGTGARSGRGRDAASIAPPASLPRVSLAGAGCDGGGRRDGTGSTGRELVQRRSDAATVIAQYRDALGCADARRAKPVGSDAFTKPGGHANSGGHADVRCNAECRAHAR